MCVFAATSRTNFERYLTYGTQTSFTTIEKAAQPNMCQLFLLSSGADTTG